MAHDAIRTLSMKEGHTDKQTTTIACPRNSWDQFHPLLPPEHARVRDQAAYKPYYFFLWKAPEGTESVRDHKVE